MIDINQDCKTGSNLINGVIHLLVQSHIYLLEFTSVKRVICEINAGSKNLSLLLNHSTECSQYMHRTAGWHFAISLSCCGGVTWLPRPLFLSLVSGQHNSNTSIAVKLPVKASFLEIAIAIMVLNHSVLSGVTVLDLNSACTDCAAEAWIDFQQVQQIFLFSSVPVEWLWWWFQMLMGRQLIHAADN